MSGIYPKFDHGEGYHLLRSWHKFDEIVSVESIVHKHLKEECQFILKSLYKYKKVLNQDVLLYKGNYDSSCISYSSFHPISTSSDIQTSFSHGDIIHILEVPKGLEYIDANECLTRELKRGKLNVDNEIILLPNETSEFQLRCKNSDSRVLVWNWKEKNWKEKVVIK